MIANTFMIIALLIISIYFFYTLYVAVTIKNLPVVKIASDTIYQTSIEVAIVCRNEEQHIAKLLDCLVKQTYPKHLFSVSIVDDQSEDNTLNLIETFIAAHPTLSIKLIKQKKNLTKNFKKNALQQIAEQSQADLIVCTDGDTYMSDKWLQSLVNFHSTNSYTFIAAPVNLVATQHSFIPQFDITEHLALQAHSAYGIIKQKATMCNGANLCYDRKTFLKAGGYDVQSTNASGDDLFLLFAFKKLNPTSIGWCNNPDAMVYTYANETSKDLFNQKIRWASKSKLYKDKDIVLLMTLIGLANLTLVVLTVFTCFYPLQFMFLVSMFVIKVNADIYLINKTNTFYKQKLNDVYLLVGGIIYPFYSFVIIILSRYLKPIWKGRAIN